MLFLGLVAFQVWPIGVMVTCFVVGLLMTLQFLVFGVHWCVLRVARGVRRGMKVARGIVGRGDGGDKMVVQEKAGL